MRIFYLRRFNACECCYCYYCTANTLQSSDVVCLQPCNHKQFHLKCISRWLRRKGQSTCPLCRTKIQELRYDFTVDGLYESEVLDDDSESGSDNGSDRDDASDRGNASDRDNGSGTDGRFEDERIYRFMPSPDVVRAKEMRRIRALGDFSSKTYRDEYVFVLADGIARNDKTMRIKSVTLLTWARRVNQERPLMYTKLERTISLYLSSAPSAVSDRIVTNMEEIAKLKMMVEQSQGCISTKRHQIILLEDKEVESWDHTRRLGGTLRQTQVNYRPDIGHFDEGIALTTTMTLTEQINNTNLSGFAQQDAKISAARSELHAHLAWFRTVHGTSEDWVEPDKGTTGILDVRFLPHCNYCSEMHGSGTCQIPRRPPKPLTQDSRTQLAEWRLSIGEDQPLELDDPAA